MDNLPPMIDAAEVIEDVTDDELAALAADPAEAAVMAHRLVDLAISYLPADSAYVVDRDGIERALLEAVVL